LAWRRGRWRLGAANERRQGDAEDPEHGGGAAGGGVAQDVALAVLLDLGLAQAFEVLHDVGPFAPGGGEAILEFLAQDESFPPRRAALRSAD